MGLFIKIWDILVRMWKDKKEKRKKNPIEENLFNKYF